VEVGSTRGKGGEKGGPGGDHGRWGTGAGNGAEAVSSDKWSGGGGTCGGWLRLVWAAMAVSCWAGCPRPEMNSENFDLFQQFQIDLN
jgi:hypothetical protein